jgi:hypothetical protein
VKGGRESVFVLRECRRCGWALCCCFTLRHAEACPWRTKRMDTRPVGCEPHQEIACEACFPCDCGKPTRPVVKARTTEEAA